MNLPTLLIKEATYIKLYTVHDFEVLCHLNVPVPVFSNATVSPCDMCTGAILLYKIPRVVIGENKTFMGQEELLRSRGVEVVVLDSQECTDMMAKFIAEKPEVSQFRNKLQVSGMANRECAGLERGYWRVDIVPSHSNAKMWYFPLFHPYQSCVVGCHFRERQKTYSANTSVQHVA